MPRKEKRAEFKKAHARKFGLKPTYSAGEGTSVESVLCRFCQTFGRETDGDEGNRKRKRTERRKNFEVFRTDLYLKHLKVQHPKKWAEYQELTDGEEQEAFFHHVEIPLQDAISETTLEPKNDVMTFLINKPIVDVILETILFDPDDAVGLTTVRQALSSFKRSEPDHDDPSENKSAYRDYYMVDINRSGRFALFVQFISCGLSFRLASLNMQHTKHKSSFSGGCSESLAATYASIVISYCLQTLSDALMSTWAFSIALDSFTQQSRPYLHIRSRFCVKDKLYDFHLLSIPVLERDSGSDTFNVAVHFLDALLPDWKQRLIGVSTGRERTRSGRLQDLYTRLSQVVEPGMIRAWSGQHWLDQVIQRVFSVALDDEFRTTLTRLVGHLRRQQELISDMRSTCPKVADTRWLSMPSTTSWLTSNRLRVMEYLNKKKPSCAPSVKWWVFLFCVHAFVSEASKAFKSLQGFTTRVSQQLQVLGNLVSIYGEMTQMIGPLTPEHISTLKPDEYVIVGRFAVTLENARLFLEGLGVWVLETMDRMEEADRNEVLRASGTMFVRAASEISEIVAEMDSAGQAGTELPPVLPKELVRIDMRGLVGIINQHMNRLTNSFNSPEVDVIGQEFSDLIRAYRCDSRLTRIIDSSSPTSFSEAWSVVGDDYSYLRQFCGGLASCYPSAALVESDFSDIAWEKDEPRSSLTNFSVEGTLQCKQFRDLQALNRLINE